MDDRVGCVIDDDYPADFNDGEPLVRIVRTPQFVKKGELRPNAFRPQRGTNRVSIVRWLYRPLPNERLKELCIAVGTQGKNTYWGLGLFEANHCDDIDVELEDAREEYRGHAHLVFPYISQQDEPLDGPNLLAQNEIAHSLLQRVIAIADPEPQSEHWTIVHPGLPTDA